MENNEKSYLSIAYDEDGVAYGVRIIGLGENFVVALCDVEGGEEVTWDEACNLKAPTKKQATLMSAVWDELNAMLQEAGGYALSDGVRRWTSTEYADNSAWYYIGSDDILRVILKCYRYGVRSVLA